MKHFKIKIWHQKLLPSSAFASTSTQLSLVSEKFQADWKCNRNLNHKLWILAQTSADTSPVKKKTPWRHFVRSCATLVDKIWKNSKIFFVQNGQSEKSQIIHWPLMGNVKLTFVYFSPAFFPTWFYKAVSMWQRKWLKGSENCWILEQKYLNFNNSRFLRRRLKKQSHKESRNQIF